eukprot:gnl/MRDRNA2_/MRDRNA2_106882_c0_seq1.p1 gnl/MRDRNA2_/MRDRNA2_106882_c0~~gnl/MRDRNA2_/MRDRNA2_106882_c0_seq1.p1  ORF type:complete len:340 (+),score=48.13 gnl/MRDRNA2_/MRDRNA2_106882_c0_seq1:84-1103(+)
MHCCPLLLWLAVVCDARLFLRSKQVPIDPGLVHATQVARYCDSLPPEHIWWDLPSAVAALEPARTTAPQHASTLQANKLEDVEWFYNEVTVTDTGPATFFMGAGFGNGYLGIQEHSSHLERHVVFSVWDGETQAEVIESGKHTNVARFGGEGTGAHADLVFPWVLMEPVQLLVHAVPDKATGTTIYSGFVHWPRAAEETGGRAGWQLLASIRVAPRGVPYGTRLLGMHSFLEVYQFPPLKPNCSGHGETRAARFGPALYRSAGNTSTFKPFPAAHLTANCPEAGCPKEGLDFHGEELEGPLSLGLIVGRTVRNKGLPTGKLLPLHGKLGMPEVLHSLPA